MDTPQTPNSQIPASPNQNPAPTTPTAPAPASPTTAVKTAGFFTGKVIAAIIGVAVVGGGIGYFVFPEPFYNTVGKYIGLPAPAVMKERAAPPEETDNNTADSEKTASDVGLFNELPGEDANYVTYFQKTDEATTVVNELMNEAEKKFGKEIGDLKETFGKLQALKYGTVGTGTEMIPDEQTLIDIASGITQVLVVAKIDYDAVKNKRGLNTNPFESELPLAVALKIPAEKEAAFLEAVKTLQSLEKNGEENPFKKISAEGRGNGIIIITNPSHPLDGKFSDNPLKGGVEATFAETNVLIAFDLRTVVEKQIKELEKELNPAMSGPTNDNDEESVKRRENLLKEAQQQLEFLKKVQNLVLSGALKKENGKSNLKINMRLGMTDEEGAQKGLELIKPQMDQLNFFIPQDYQEFLKTNLAAEEGELALELTVEDLVALEQKIFAALEASGRPKRIRKPLIDEAPADLPNLNQPDPSVLEGKVRRKKN